MSSLERWLAVRDRWLSNAKFQRWAAAFPLTRPIARRRARALFDVCAGFVYSQILFACVRLKLFELLAEGPLTAADLAARLVLPPASTERLLEAAIALGLVERRAPERFGLGHLGAALLGNPAVGAMIEHHKLLYADLADPVGLLRGERRPTELSQYWSYARTPAGVDYTAPVSGDYTALMSSSQPLVADEILDAYPLGKHRCLLDVGGGDGSFLIRAGNRYPHLELRLLDLAAVADRAARRFADLGFGPRARATAGDFRSVPLPTDADVISLIRVVHDHDDTVVLQLFASVHRALPPRGVLLLAEPMRGTVGAEPVADAYFGFYLLAMGQGRPRTPDVLMQMLRTVGFKAARLLRTRQPLQTRLIVASKASD